MFILVWLFTYNAWLFFGKETFEIGQALIIFFLSFIIIKEFPNKVTAIMFILATNQLADELFFNPFEISWNEYITVLFTILVSFFGTRILNLAKCYLQKKFIK